MNRTRPFVIAVGLILGGQLAFAQDVSRYRAYALESSLESVVAASGARAVDAKTLHERPVTIQELGWRAKSLSARARTAVREAVRLDAIEAPRREVAQRKTEAGEASAARDKTRIANKAAFRP